MFATIKTKRGENMDIIVDKLYEMKPRLGMYLGIKSLTLLKVYIEGYIARQIEFDATFKSTYWGFTEYVQKHFNINHNRNWLSIILFFSPNEEAAVDLFYELLDEFLQTSITAEK